MFISLSPDQGFAIRSKLLETLVTETERPVRNKISDAVAEIARQYAENNDSWPDLLQSLFQLSQDADAGKREIAFRIFTSTPGIIGKQHEEPVAHAFTVAFKDDSVAVRTNPPAWCKNGEANPSTQFGGISTKSR